MKTITALIRAKDSHEDLKKLRILFSQLIDETRKEEGSIKYDLHEVPAQPGLFIMMEEWVSEAAMEFHNTSKHFENFLASAQPYLTAPIEEFDSIKIM